MGGRDDPRLSPRRVVDGRTPVIPRLLGFVAGTRWASRPFRRSPWRVFRRLVDPDSEPKSTVLHPHGGPPGFVGGQDGDETQTKVRTTEPTAFRRLSGRHAVSSPSWVFPILSKGIVYFFTHSLPSLLTY